MPPFRTPVSDEEEWSPPSYAAPVSEEKSSEAWKPPDYAEPIKKEKEKPGIISRAIEAVKPPKRIHATGSLIPSSLLPKKEEKLKEERLTGDEYVKYLSEGGKPYYDPDKKEETKQGFVQSVLSSALEHPYTRRILTSQNPAEESFLPTAQEVGAKEPETYWGGFRRGLYNEFIRPLASPTGAAMLLAGGTSEEPIPSIRSVIGEPIKQPREIPALTKTTPQQDAVAIALTRDIPRSAKAISEETGIPAASVRRTISELKKKTIGTLETPSPPKGEEREEPIRRPVRDLSNVTPISEDLPLGERIAPERPTPPVTEESIAAAKAARNKELEEVGKARAKEIEDAIVKEKRGRLGLVKGEEGKLQLPGEFAPVEREVKDKYGIPSKLVPEVSERRYQELLAKQGGTLKEEKPEFVKQFEEKVGRDKKEEFKPPDYATLVEEPQAARTSEGKLAIGADVKSLGKVLGTSLYKGDIAPIATKELLQNSIDATRHLGDQGKIDVLLDRSTGTIQVKDNGKGLTRGEIESVFTNLGSSGKREDISAAGGFGLAKAAPLLGGDRVEVTTIARDSKTGKLMRHSFEGSPNELLEGVDIKAKSVPEGTQTGTTVKVHVPKDSDYYSAGQFVQNLTEHSPNIQGNVRLASIGSEGKYLPTIEEHYRDLPKGKGTSLATLDNPSAQTELIVPGDSRRTSRSLIKLNLSNNGMYQGSKYIYFEGEVPNIPDSLTVDVRPKVPEGHGDYPFTANREELRGSVEEQVKKYIDENVVKPSVGRRADELRKIYTSMPEITVGRGEFPNVFGHKIAIYDPKGQISPSEMQNITSNSSFHTLAGNIAGILKEALKTAGLPAWSNRLEKIGIIFDDKLHGIHIPNPGTGKSAILINPFIAIDKMSSDEASANILHTILHEMAHIEPVSPGHNEAFTVRLGDIYGKFGARRSVEAQDNILKSIADPNTGLYHPEIQKILSTYKESRGREATTEDLLSGTGIGSRPKGRGEGTVPPGGESAREGVTRNAVNKLFESMNQARDLLEEQKSINIGERAKRFAAFAGVKEEGAAGAAKSLGKLRGEFEKVQPGRELGLKDEEADSLFTAVKRANVTEGEKARGYTALFKLLNGDRIPARSELAILDDVFGNGFADRVERSGLFRGEAGFLNIRGAGIKLSKLASTMKSMQNAISLAAPLRHGIGLIARKEFYPAFGDMFKFFANKEYYNASMRALQERPNYLLGRDAGLFLSKPGSLMNSEEEFLNSYAGNIPGVSNLVGASQRAYTGFLNKLRSDVFDSMVKQAESLGHEVSTKVGDSVESTNATKAIVRFINNATGRGSLGPLNKVTNEMNLLFWSPRMIASRITMLTNPKIYISLPQGMRLEGLKSLFAIAALGTTIDTLAAYAGAKVSTNILSTDFGKSRFGTKLIDPWGGFQQYIVAAARFLAGKTDAARPASRLEIAGRFLANKESPIASLAHNILTAKKFTGKGDLGIPGGGFVTQYGQQTSVQREVARQFAPIFIQDIQKLAESEPDWSENIGLTAAMAGASLAGMAQDYPQKKGRLGFRRMRIR